MNSGTLQINGIGVSCNDITIDALAFIDVMPGKSLNVSGNINNLGTFTLQSDETGKLGNPTGSLIVDGTISGNISVERYIAGHGNVADAGWHLLSSPMTSYTVAGSEFEPGVKDDLYWYDEPADMWRNYKVSAFDFVKGKGYLCSYESGEIKTFAGAINNANTTVNGLTVQGSGVITDAGWNMLGNPFTSAIQWSNLWGANIIATAKIYPGSGNYDDVDPGDYIPAMQGFFVQVTSATSVIIPTNAQDHSTIAWTKAQQSDIQTLKLKVSGGTNSFYDIARIRFNEEATEEFDNQFDSHKIFGQASAPQLYTELGNELVSTNTLTNPDFERDINLDFIPGTTGEYTIEVVENTVVSDKNIYLEDLIANVTIDLSNNSEYHFTATTGDNENRFKLHFGATGIDNEPIAAKWLVYASGQQLFVSGENGQTEVSVYNTQGQQVMLKKIEIQGEVRLPLNLSTGVYLVTLNNGRNVETTKIIIK